MAISVLQMMMMVRGRRIPFLWQGDTSFTDAGFNADADVWIQFETNGSGSEDAVANTFDGWHEDQPSVGLGTGLYVRANTTTGTLDGSTSLSPGVWYEISAARRFGVFRDYSVQGDGNDTWTGTFSIGYNGSTATWTSPTITLTATTSTL